MDLHVEFTYSWVSSEVYMICRSTPNTYNNHLYAIKTNKQKQKQQQNNT